jgi:hypothetical protein
MMDTHNASTHVDASFGHSPALTALLDDVKMEAMRELLAASLRDERRFLIPACRRDRKSALHEILAERRTRQRRQCDLAGPAALADQM